MPIWCARQRKRVAPDEWTVVGRRDKYAACVSDWVEVLWEPADAPGARDVGRVTLKRWLEKHHVDPTNVDERGLRIDWVKTADGAAARVMMSTSELERLGLPDPDP